MAINAKEQKRLTNLYNSLVKYYLESDGIGMDYDDKPFYNFSAVLYEHLRDHPYFCIDIFNDTINWQLRDLENNPSDMMWDDVIYLIQRIEKNFEINKYAHYIIFPLQNSGLKSDISFRNFHFIVCKSKEEAITKIYKIAKIKDLKNKFDHTENSRSKDFFKHNLLVVKINNQTSFVRYSAKLISEYMLYFLQVIYCSENMESSIFRMSESWFKENNHVAVISKQSWRCSHSPLWFDSKCNIDIDFMAETKYQKIFFQLYNAFILERNRDDLSIKFLNALILFNKGYEQETKRRDKSLAILLYFSAAESLLTENKNEKSLRLTAILSRLVKVPGYSPSKIAESIQTLYLKRNDFVHAGREIYISEFDENGDKHENELQILRMVISKLLLLYLNIDKRIGTMGDNENRLLKWDKYVNSVFSKMILGE